MKKCRKNLLLVIEFVVALVAIITIVPLSYFGKILPEVLVTKLSEFEDVCRYIGFAGFILLASICSLFAICAANRRNGEVAFAFRKAFIFPLVSYTMALCAYLLFEVYNSVIFKEQVGQFTAYLLVAIIIILVLFYGLLARVIYKKEKKFLPILFNLILIGMFAGAIIIAFENKEYFVDTNLTLTYFNFALPIFGGLILLNYIILDVCLTKQCKFEAQKKAVNEVKKEIEADEAKIEQEEVALETVAEEVEEEKAEEVEVETVAVEVVEEKAEVEAEETPTNVEIVAQVKEVAEEKPKPASSRKQIKPTPQALLKYLQANFEDIMIVVDPDGVSFKASRKKKLFLNLKVGANDYRITFQRKPVSIPKLMVKYTSITKAKTPAGDQWFKLVNKGEFTEGDLHNIIKASYNFSVEEEAKEALRKQKEKEKEAERRKKEREKAKLAAAKKKA